MPVNGSLANRQLGSIVECIETSPPEPIRLDEAAKRALAGIPRHASITRAEYGFLVCASRLVRAIQEGGDTEQLFAEASMALAEADKARDARRDAEHTHGGRGAVE